MLFLCVSAHLWLVIFCCPAEDHHPKSQTRFGLHPGRRVEEGFLFWVMELMSTVGCVSDGGQRDIIPAWVLFSGSLRYRVRLSATRSCERTLPLDRPIHCRLCGTHCGNQGRKGEVGPLRFRSNSRRPITLALSGASNVSTQTEKGFYNGDGLLLPCEVFPQVHLRRGAIVGGSFGCRVCARRELDRLPASEGR